MQSLALHTAEENKAREQVQLELARWTKRLRDFEEDPEAAIEAMDVAPHLRNRA